MLRLSTTSDTIRSGATEYYVEHRLELYDGEELNSTLLLEFDVYEYFKAKIRPDYSRDPNTHILHYESGMIPSGDMDHPYEDEYEELGLTKEEVEKFIFDQY